MSVMFQAGVTGLKAKAGKSMHFGFLSMLVNAWNPSSPEALKPQSLGVGDGKYTDDIAPAHSWVRLLHDVGVSCSCCLVLRDNGTAHALLTRHP